MSGLLQKLVVVGTLMCMVACAPLSNVKPTVEKTRTVSLPNQVLFEASLRYAQDQHWTVDSSEEGLGWVEAVSAVDESEGMMTRERWIITTRDSEVGIQLHLEFLKHGKWQSIDLVCDGYSYFRESQHLSGIAATARSAGLASLPAGHASQAGAR